MILSIIIPVFNEEKTLAQVLKRVDAVKMKNIKKELIVVNDGSTDSTPDVLSNSTSKIADCTIITHKINKGKGEAVRSGMSVAKGDYIVIQDADLEYDPNDLEKLLAPIISGESKVVYGTRLKRLPNFHHDERTGRFFIHYIGNKTLSLLTSVLYGQWITDMETGYKVFPRDLLADISLTSRGFEFEPEITAKILKKGYHIFEVPIKTNPRGYNDGKKLNTLRDGMRALWTLAKYRVVS
jgi:dolichol-phosphate mannosyltransferase